MSLKDRYILTNAEYGVVDAIISPQNAKKPAVNGVARPCGVLVELLVLAGLLRIILVVSHYQSPLEILYYLGIGMCDGGRWWQAPTLKRRLAQ
jgi:hypothetical protein